MATVAPATVALVEIAKVNSPFTTALLRGLGALCGDLIIFHFIRDRISEDIAFLLKNTGSKRFFSIFKRPSFKWLVAFCGALIIASPLPDELGITMTGLYKIKLKYFAPISFALNSLGILVIALLARVI